MRDYEVMVIVDPEADDQKVKAVTDRIGQTLSERGGEVVSLEPWGKRRLSYEIAKKTEGTYVLAVCKAEPEAVAELDRVLSLADEVIRFKIIKKVA